MKNTNKGDQQPKELAIKEHFSKIFPGAKIKVKPICYRVRLEQGGQKIRGVMHKDPAGLELYFKSRLNASKEQIEIADEVFEKDPVKDILRKKINDQAEQLEVQARQINGLLSVLQDFVKPRRTGYENELQQ